MKLIILINRRCSAVNQPKIIVFAIIENQFNVLSNYIKIVKKYEFLVQNRNKIPKFQFFVIFVRIDENIQSIFSILQIWTTKIKIRVLRKKKIKNWLKIRRVAIFFFQISLNKFWQQKFTFNFPGLDLKKFSLFLLLGNANLFLRIRMFCSIFPQNQKN